MYWKTNMKQREGVIFGWFMILLWMVRFVIEFWKEKQGGESIANYLNMGQILSIPMILIGVYFVFRKTETKS
jgi:prolipoprotein diacylglyceryltransferase